jgi:hypothetical protein
MPSVGRALRTGLEPTCAFATTDTHTHPAPIPYAVDAPTMDHACLALPGPWCTGWEHLAHATTEPAAGNGAPIPVPVEPRRRHHSGYGCSLAVLALCSRFIRVARLGRRPGWSGTEAGAQARPGAGPRAGSGASRLDEVERLLPRYGSTRLHCRRPEPSGSSRDGTLAPGCGAAARSFSRVPRSSERDGS